MKRLHIYIFLILFTALAHYSCSKADASSATGTTVSGAGGSLAKFAIVGNYMYMVDYASLNVYDIADPTAPVKKEKVQIGFDIETIFPYKDKLFIGGQTGMYIFNISNPVKPVSEGSVVHVRACDPVVSSDTVSYVTLRTFGTNCGNTANVLNVYDIRNMKAPKLATTIAMGNPMGLGIKQNALYVCDTQNGLVVFDLNDPYRPSKVKTLKDDIRYYDVIPYNNVLIAYINSGVCFYDITNPLNPVLLSILKG